MKQINFYLSLWVLIIGLVAGWYSHEYYGKPEKPHQQTISVDIQPPKETIKNFKEKPIEFTDEKKYEKHMKDADNGISHLKFKSGDTEVYLSLKGLAFDVKIDSVEFTPQPVHFDTTLVYNCLEPDSGVTAKLTIAYMGSLSVGALIANEKYTEAGIVGAITFISVYFYDSILMVWKWL